MRRLALLAALLALALAACGGDDGGGEAETGECPDGAVVVAMRDIKFDPEDATAGVGQEICWPNEDSIDHNVVAESGADFESDLYGQGEIFTAAVSRPGRVEYVCTIHPGMVGSLTIER